MFMQPGAMNPDAVFGLDNLDNLVVAPTIQVTPGTVLPWANAWFQATSFADSTGYVEARLVGFNATATVSAKEIDLVSIAGQSIVVDMEEVGYAGFTTVDGDDITTTFGDAGIVSLMRGSRDNELQADSITLLSLAPYTDGLTADVGYVGELYADDVWHVDVRADAIGTLIGSDLRGWELEADFLGSFGLNEVDDSEFDIGFTYGGWLEGEDNDLNIGYLFGTISLEGEDNDLDVEGGRGQIFAEGEGSSIELENFSGRLKTGDDIITEVEESEVGVDLGADNILEAEDSFVVGEVGEGTEVFLEDSRAILELAGGNYVGLDGGQLLVDADNGAVDTFYFTGGALVDGTFDHFDQVQLGSGARWEMGELAQASGGDQIELPDDVVIAAQVESSWDYLAA